MKPVQSKRSFRKILPVLLSSVETACFKHIKFDKKKTSGVLPGLFLKKIKRQDI